MLEAIGTRVRALLQRVPERAPDIVAQAAPAPVREQLARGAVDDAARGRRVLVFTMNSGGHLALAKSIRQDVARIDPTATVEIVDGMAGRGKQATDSGFNRAIAWLHKQELEHTPWTYEAQHRLRYTSGGIRLDRAISDRLFRRRVAEQVASFRPDVVVSTHERVTAPLGAMRGSGELQVPVVAALADANPHGGWVSPGVDQHVLYHGSDLARLPRVFAGGATDTLRAVVARPPVDPRAFATYDRAAVREAFGLPTDRRVALVSGGSTGIPVPDEDIRRALAETDFHLAIPTGRNQESMRHLGETFPPDRVTPIPFTTEMPSLLATSDVAVLNANGATSVEAFAARTPVVVYRPVAGHGKTSAAAIDADRVATYAKSTDELVDALRRVDAGDPEIAARVDNASALFDRPISYGDAILGARLAN